MPFRFARASLLALPFLAGCGGTNPVMPTDLTAGAAAGEAACDDKALTDEAMTFVVDWQDGQRTALESAMGKGVAVVKYACAGVKVLPACRVSADYAYAGATRRKKVVKMHDAVQAQAEFGGRHVGAAFKGQFAQGRSLAMAYTTVGANATTLAEVNTSMLTGRCKGATHFVYEASVGAFAVATASKGAASAFGAVFGQGAASAATSGAKSSVTREGTLEACEATTKRDITPAAGCEANVRLSLIPVETAPANAAPVPAKLAGVPDLRGCPSGFALVDGACMTQAKLATASPALKAKQLCDKNAFGQCLERCVGGEMGSCGRLGLIFLEGDRLKRADSTYSEAAFKNQAANLKGPLAQACLAGEANACVAAGYVAGLVGYPGKDAPESWKTPGAAKFHRAVMALDVEGCRGGEGVACEQMIASLNLPDELQSMPIKAMLPILKQGCARSSYACLSLGGLYAHNDGTKYWSQAADAVSQDAAAARAAFTRACDGGLADGCWALGLMHMPEDDVTSKAMDAGVDRGTLSTVSSMAALGKDHTDAARGLELLARACALGEAAFIRAPREVACAIK